MNIFIDPSKCNDLAKKITLSESAYSAYSADSDNGFDLKHGDNIVYRLDDMCQSIDKVWFAKRARCKRADCPHIEELHRSYGGKKFKTADCFVDGKDGFRYFIEFKSQPIENIEKEDVCSKAVESLFCASLTVLNDMPMHEVADTSVFVLVFKVKNKESAPKESAADRLIAPVEINAGRVKFGGEAKSAHERIRLGLQGLEKFKLYRNVYTLTEDEFNEFSDQIFGD